MEKGFARTAIGRELSDPKLEINFEEGAIGAFRVSARASSVGPRLDEREVGQKSDLWIRDFAEAQAASETSVGRLGRVVFSY